MTAIATALKEVWSWVKWIFKVGKLAQRVDQVVKRYSQVEAAVEENEDKIAQAKLELTEARHEMERALDARLDALRIDLERKDKEMYKFIAENK